MRNLFFIVFVFVIVALGQAQSVKSIKLAQLLKRIESNNDTVVVVNFWATWCSPCVKELPDFEEAYRYFKGKKVKILLVSLDFKKDIGRVRAFLVKNNIQNKVVLLDETNYNAWIDKIEPSWGGAIPATLILKNSAKTKQFIGNSITFEELKTFINPLL